MNFNTTFRLNASFSGITNSLIQMAMKAKNGDGFNGLSETLLAEAKEELSLLETGEIFTAMSKTAPLTAVTQLNVDAGNSILDVMIDTMATMLVNDVLAFVGADGDMLIVDPADASNPTYQTRDKRKRKINTAVAVDQNSLSDELRDELSGAGVTAGAGDNDCSGGACAI